MNNSIRTAAKTMAAVIAAGAMAVAPVAGTINFGAMTAMAAPTADDKGTISVSGVGTGATVNAYQIVKAKYSDAGFEKWEYNGTALANADGTYTPTVTEMATLVAAIKADTQHTTYTKVELTYNQTSQKYTSSQAPAGEYVVLVESTGNNDTYVYNPMVVSTSYDKNDTLTTNGTADATTNFGSGDTAYAKRSEIPLTKTITNLDGESGKKSGTEAQGEDLQVGDTGDFKITSKIPSYSSAYTNVTFTLTDIQDAGFNAPTDITVYVGGLDDTHKVTENATSTFSITKETTRAQQTDKDGKVTAKALDTNDFEVSFVSSYILAHTGEDVYVTYKSVLNENAVQANASDDNINQNTVGLVYTKDIFENTDAKEAETYHYTFPVNVFKQAAETTADANQDGNKKYTTDGHEILSGAKFEITRMHIDTTEGNTKGKLVAYTDTEHVAYPGTEAKTDTKEVTTDADGKAVFNDLDEGYYMIKETQAPSGFSTNTEAFYIKITPTYGDDGKLASYSVTQVGDDGQATSIPQNSTGSVDDSTDTLTVNDTPMAGLPSTGARSALILTIAGIAVMITVMAASRRKKIAD